MAVQPPNDAFVKQSFTADFATNSDEDFFHNQEPKSYDRNQKGFSQENSLCSNFEWLCMCHYFIVFRSKLFLIL